MAVGFGDPRHGADDLDSTTDLATVADNPLTEAGGVVGDVDLELLPLLPHAVEQLYIDEAGRDLICQLCGKLPSGDIAPIEIR